MTFDAMVRQMPYTSEYPYSTVALVQDEIGGQTYEASGVLISPDELLTASHVVYEAGVGTASSVLVAPGYNQGSEPYGVLEGTNFHYNAVNDANDLIGLADSQSDYAVIHLSRPVAAGTMQLGVNVPGGYVNVSGYPASAAGAQTTINEIVSKDPTYSLFDGVDTGSGSSGSPLWYDQNGAATVIGVVSSGDGTNGYDSQITSAAASLIRGWVNADDFPSPLIDVPYYLLNNPDVENAGVSAVAHYNGSGWHEGRDPDPLFSTNGYLDTNTDVARAGVNPVQHYDQSGWKEGRDPSAEFSTILYEQRNPDVAAAGIDPLSHYLSFGEAEGRTALPAIGHGDEIGDFDPHYYLLANPDVARAAMASGNPDAFAYQHYSTLGWHEGRNPDAYFNTDYYLAQNPDVAAAGVDPLTHYEASGWHEGRNPSAAFSTHGYETANPDVAAAGVDPLQHFLAFGAWEGRNPVA
ncbi:trypsin-like serine peptidase [Lichenifustis flavocetrariae]|uniref:Serine protease n=1 Tax=Lichenifustis flavocetrariae TaxID=2949735 RepID=A0AA42CQP2_9HYPH|nr:trypsin-like serine protease [Lichenifustis flavocetrariae]MCW6511630.1 trypsin-like serine protease [Lichenifustis flavocetrariae]